MNSSSSSVGTAQFGPRLNLRGSRTPGRSQPRRLRRQANGCRSVSEVAPPRSCKQVCRPTWCWAFDHITATTAERAWAFGRSRTPSWVPLLRRSARPRRRDRSRPRAFERRWPTSTERAAQRPCDRSSPDRPSLEVSAPERSPRSRSQPRPPRDRSHTRSAQPHSTHAPAPATSAANRPASRSRARTAPATAPPSSHRSPRHEPTRHPTDIGHRSGHRRPPHSVVEPISGQTNPREERPATQPGRQPLQQAARAIVSSRRSEAAGRSDRGSYTDTSRLHMPRRSAPS